jgi:hypothetical protein
MATEVQNPPARRLDTLIDQFLDEKMVIRGMRASWIAAYRLNLVGLGAGYGIIGFTRFLKSRGIAETR